MICHSNFVTSLEFGFEGQTLYSGDRTGTVALWETIVGDHYIFKVRIPNQNPPLHLSYTHVSLFIYS